MPFYFNHQDTLFFLITGIVVSGYLSSGLVELNSVLQAGPFDDGSFVDVVISGLQRHKVSRQYVRPGESSTLAITSQDESKSDCLEKAIRKGTVLLSPSDQNISNVCVCFVAQIFSMPNSTEISIGFQGK